MTIAGIKIDLKKPELLSYEDMFNLVWNSKSIRGLEFKKAIEKDLKKNGFKPASKNRKKSKADQSS